MTKPYGENEKNWTVLGQFAMIEGIYSSSLFRLLKDFFSVHLGLCPHSQSIILLVCVHI